MSVMALRKLPYGRFDAWMSRYERKGFSIRDVLEGRVSVGRFCESSQLEVMIDLIFTFFDIERGN